MSNTLQIDLPVQSSEQGEIIIAELSSINFHAFQENDNILSLFIKEEYFDESIFKSALSNFELPYTKKLIANINWNQKWESEFTPVIINDFVAVRAAFHKPVKNVNHEIIITPKMSFGTGHHATTYLMLEQMAALNFKDKKVLDFGTGTGVLSILASKLGAAAITAVDNDEWSIENAKENLLTNESKNIRLLKADSIANLGTFNIILANINLNVITQNVSGLKMISGRGTQLLLSGFLKQNEKELNEVFIKNGFTFERVQEKDGWICVRYFY